MTWLIWGDHFRKSPHTYQTKMDISHGQFHLYCPEHGPHFKISSIMILGIPGGQPMSASYYCMII